MSFVPVVFGVEPHPWLDMALFHAIHPAVKPVPLVLAAAKVLAVGPLLISYVVLLLVGVVTRAKNIVVEAVAATTLALVLNWILGIVWYRPRPFLTAGIRAWVKHASTSSFPSDHLTIQWCIAGVLLSHRRTRVAGVAVALLGLPMAWARIYLGVHYPSDMLGAAVVAACFSGVAVWMGHRYSSPSKLGSGE